MRYFTIIVVLLVAAPTFAQSRFQRNGEWAEIAQDAVRDRLRSRNRVWETREREKIRNERYGSSSKIDVGEELKAIGVGWIAGEVLGRQANSLENERDWNRATVDAWREEQHVTQEIREDWARTDQRIMHDQARHSHRMDDQLLRSNQRAYETYLREAPVGSVPMTFQQFLNGPSCAMPQMVAPVPVTIERPTPSRVAYCQPRPAGVATQVVNTTTSIATTTVGAVTGSSSRICSAAETRARYGR